MKYIQETQYYKGIDFILIIRVDYDVLPMRQYMINNSKYTLWLKEEFVQPDGTIIPSLALDEFLSRAVTKLESAGVSEDVLKQFKPE